MTTQKEINAQVQSDMGELKDMMSKLIALQSNPTPPTVETPVKKVATPKAKANSKKENTFVPRAFDTAKGDILEPLANYPQVNDAVNSIFAQQYSAMQASYENPSSKWRTSYTETDISPVCSADCQNCKIAFDEVGVKKLKALRKTIIATNAYYNYRGFETTTICNLGKGVYNKES